MPCSRPLRRNPDALGCGRHIGECNLSIRVLRVSYEDGPEWAHPVPAARARPAP